MPPENTPNKAGPSLAGAIIVGAFVTLVFDNLALGIIFGLMAGGGIAARASRS